jgi:hypothetical protein
MAFPDLTSLAMALAIATAFLSAGLLLVSRRRTRRWRIVCILLPGAAAVFSLLAAADLHIPLPSRLPARIIILLDLSASTHNSPWRDPGWLRAFAQRRLDPAMRVTVVGFARQPRLLLDDASPADPARWPSSWPLFGDDDQTDLVAAAAWRSSAETSGKPLAPRWIITDALLSWPPDLSAAVTILPSAPDAAITDLTLHDRALWIRVRAVGDVPPRDFDIRRDGKLLAREHLTFTPNSSRWLSLLADDATALYDVRLSPADPWPEDDAAQLVHTASDAPRVLTIRGGPQPPDVPADAWQLAADGWQVICLLDVAAEDLPPDRWHLLDKFVRHTGGGVVLAGGRRAFGPGDYASSDLLESLSPLWRGPHDGTPARVCFLLDASASMNDAAVASNAQNGEQKFRIAARAVEGALPLLAPGDHVSLIAFNTAATLLAAGTRDEVHARLDAALASVRPAGGTDPDAVLPTLAAALNGSPATTRTLAVLLSDGEIPHLDVARWRAALSAADATLVIIAPPAARNGPLAALAQGNIWLDAPTPQAWALLLRQALAPLVAGKARTDPLAWNAPTGLAGTSTAWTETWPKTGPADAPSLADGHAAGAMWPVAAVAQRGLGRVAALSLTPDSPAADALLDHLTRLVMPPAGDRRFSLNAIRDERSATWLLTADGSADGRFLDGESLSVRFANPLTHVFETRPLDQTGPGHFTARLPVASGAVILRTDAAGDHLVGRIEAPTLASDEWPAMREPSPLPLSIIQLPVEGNVVWRPASARATHWNLTPALGCVAALAALAALWGRRAGGS